MCNPALIMMGITLATTAAQQYGQYKTGKAQAQAIANQNEQQADEIAQAAGQEMTERARAARRERASMRAAASASGVNLGSGSFVSALQASVFNQYNDQGLVLQNERNRQKSREAQAASAMAGVSIPTAFSSSLQIGAAAYSGYQQGKQIETTGTKRGTH